jgi:hypothetical protein
VKRARTPDRSGLADSAKQDDERISAIARVVREVRNGFSRRQREELVARHSVEQAVWSELNESVTAMPLSCDLALSAAGVPAPAAEKIRAVHSLAFQLRARLGPSE